MSYKIEKVVIVGGGSAGWMTAATFIKAFPNKDITLIESSDVPTVGVGESTVSEFTSWLNYLDIDYKEFMKHTNAAYKLAIGFTNFKLPKSPTFFYPFGTPDKTSTHFGLNDWHFRRAADPTLPDSDYVEYYDPSAGCFNTNKIVMDRPGPFYPYFRPEKDAVYQFDASLFADWLATKYAVPRGVKRIIGTVGRINGSEEGITSVVLQDGTEIFGDLFIDCTGFKSLLLGGYLKEPFHSTNDILPNNKAWAAQVPYTDKEKELRTYTDCTGDKNGWVWNTPLWNRIGTGYVYSNEFVDDDTALQEFKDHLNSDTMVCHDPHRSEKVNFKKIDIKNGYYNRFWVKNVCAIGLSAAFLEPLESTGLLFIHLFAMDLISTLQNRDIVTKWDIEAFNKNNVNKVYLQSIFVALHFQLSQRDDTPYWKNITSEREYPDEHFAISAQIWGDKGNGFILERDACIAVGLGYTTLTPSKLNQISFYRDKNMYKDLSPYFEMRAKKRQMWKEAIDKAPTHYQYLKENIYNEE